MDTGPERSRQNSGASIGKQAAAIAPHLRVPEPKDRPAASLFHLLQSSGLASDVSLLHKLGLMGMSDLQSPERGCVGEIERQYRPYLEPDMRVDQASRSAVIRIACPRSAWVPLSRLPKRPSGQDGAEARLLSMYKRFADSWPV